MKTHLLSLLLVASGLGWFCRFAAAEEAVVRKATGDAQPAAERETHLLRYKFQPGQTLRWDVEHRSNLRTTINGTTKATESFTGSVKVWRVTGVADDGAITFEYSVERVRMRQKEQGKREVTFDSESDDEPLPQFEPVARTVGVPLTAFTIDPRGAIVQRVDAASRPAGSDEALITMPLPEMPVGPGDQWSVSSDVAVLKGTRQQILKTRRLYTLVSVQHGIAVVEAEAQVLTPLNAPELEVQVVQKLPTEEIRFDIEAGRVVSLQGDIDKTVVGFAGEQSAMTCLTRLTESLRDDTEPTARRNPLRK